MHMLLLFNSMIYYSMLFALIMTSFLQTHTLRSSEVHVFQTPTTTELDGNVAKYSSEIQIYTAQPL